MSAINNQKVLSEGFRKVRELMGMPQSTYAKLFEAERALVQELEEGRLPAVLDHRLLKFMLLVFTLNPKRDFVAALLQEIRNVYGLDHIFSDRFPLLALYEQVLGPEITNWPWVIESIKFRCRAIERKRLGSFLLLWGQKSDIHFQLLNSFPQQTSAFLNFIDGRTIIVIPSLYLFLDLNTSQSNNPLIKNLELKLERRETIGLALPRELPVPTTDDALVWDKLRLFAYSQDTSQLREAAFR